MANITKISEAELEEYGLTQRQFNMIVNTVAKGIGIDELRLFLWTANKYGLDPLLKQIYIIPYRQKDSTGKYVTVPQIVVGRDGLLAIAHKTKTKDGEIAFDGMYTTVEKVDEPLYINGKKIRDWQYKATCEVYRKDMNHPIHVEVWEEEYTTGKHLWATKPRTMIQKVAEAHALRRAFNVAGIYTEEELIDRPVEEYVAENVNKAPKDGKITQKQLKYIWKLISDLGELSGEDPQKIEERIKQHEGIEHLKDLDQKKASGWIDRLKKAINKFKVSEDEVVDTSSDEEVIFDETNEG